MFNCQQCKRKYPRDNVKQDALFKQKSCREIRNEPQFKYKATYSMEGSPNIMFNTCVANFKNSGAVEFINIEKSFSEGVMPFSGGILEQPSKFVELMELVHNLKIEHQKEMEKKLEKYNGRKRS